jgi:hypothetical protein
MRKSRTIDVYTCCLSCGTPAQIPSTDSAVSFVVVGRHVESAVHGRNGIRRIVPKLPDSVTFSRGDQSGALRSVSVGVKTPGR